MGVDSIETILSYEENVSAAEKQALFDYVAQQDATQSTQYIQNTVLIFQHILALGFLPPEERLDCHEDYSAHENPYSNATHYWDYLS